MNNSVSMLLATNVGLLISSYNTCTKVTRGNRKMTATQVSNEAVHNILFKNTQYAMMSSFLVLL